VITRWASIAKIEVNKKHSGTGFLVTDQHILTASHVVKDDEGLPFKELVVRFYPDHEFHDDSAEVINEAPEIVFEYSSLKYDFALLKCSNVPRGAIPFPVSALCSVYDNFVTPGFAIDNPKGFTIGGKITSLNEPMKLGAPALGLQIKGDGLRLSGHSGSPVIVDGLVVGILRSALLDPNKKSVGGLVYATSIGNVIKNVEALSRLIRPEPPPEPKIIVWSALMLLWAAWLAFALGAWGWAIPVFLVSGLLSVTCLVRRISVLPKPARGLSTVLRRLAGSNPVTLTSIGLLILSATLMAVSPVVNIKDSNTLLLTRGSWQLSGQNVVWGHFAMGDCLTVWDSNGTPQGCMQIAGWRGTVVDLDAYVRPLEITPLVKDSSSYPQGCLLPCELVAKVPRSNAGESACRGGPEFNVKVTFSNGDSGKYEESFRWCGNVAHFVFRGEERRSVAGTLQVCKLGEDPGSVQSVTIDRFRKTNTSIVQVTVDGLPSTMKFSEDADKSRWRAQNKCN